MSVIKTWLIDFDETLASSSISWAFKGAIPKFAQEKQLTYDHDRLASVMLIMQERASQTDDVDGLLREFFELMGWPLGAHQQLLDDLLSNYRPSLYDDVLAFLGRLTEASQRVFIVSNNARAPEHIKLLKIETYVSAVFTPDQFPNTKPKPDPSLWNRIAAHQADIDPLATVVVGDDPWSDGKFAEACNLSCWIVDRMNRFTTLRSQTPYNWVSSLTEIPI